jgi:hypothetical protein
MNSPDQKKDPIFSAEAELKRQSLPSGGSASADEKVVQEAIRRDEELSRAIVEAIKEVHVAEADEEDYDGPGLPHDFNEYDYLLREPTRPPRVREDAEKKAAKKKKGGDDDDEDLPPTAEEVWLHRQELAKRAAVKGGGEGGEGGGSGGEQ